MEIYNGTYCVYIHTNKINGKMYVGQTAGGFHWKYYTEDEAGVSVCGIK